MRFVVRITAALALGILVIVAIGVGRLASGPLDLGFLTPQLQAALDAQVPETSLTLGGTVLAWDGERRAVEVRALDVVVADAAGATLATVPEMAVRLSVAALLRGTAAPQAIDVADASLRLTGADALALPADDTPPSDTDPPQFDVDSVATFLASLMSAPAGEGTAGYLTELRLRNAALEFVDAAGNVAWTIDGADLTVTRAADAVRAAIAAELHVGDRSAPLLGTAVRVNATGVSTATFTIDDTPPAMLLAVAAAWLPPVPDLTGLAALSGTATLRLDEDFAVVDAQIELAAPFTATANLTPGPQPAVTVTFNDLDPAGFAAASPALAEAARLDAVLDGAITAGLDADWRPVRATARVRAGPGNLDLPEVYPDAPVVFAGITLAATAQFVDGQPDNLTVDQLTLDLGRGTAVVTGAAQRNVDIFDVTVDATAAGVAVNDLDTLWPPQVGKNPRQWVTRNLEDGIVPRATMQLSGSAPATAIDGGPVEFTVAAISGEIDFTGVTTHYLRPMPPVRNTAGVARYTAAEFIIDVESGVRDNLTVEAAQVRLTGLDSSEEVADVDLTVVGPVVDALTLLDAEPLGYTSELGLDPADAGGEQRTNVVFRIPLKSNVSLDDVGVAAAASLTGFTLADGPFGKSIDGGDLALEVDKNHLVAWGDIDLGGIALTGSWTENFAGEASYVTQYEATGILSGTDLADLGLDLGGAITGDVAAGVTYAILPDGAAVGAADLDLLAAAVDIPSVGLSKPTGMPAQTEVQFVVEDGILSDIPDFRFVADGLSINGAVQFVPDPADPESSTVSRMVLPRVVFNNNDLGVTIDFPLDDTDPLDIRLSGTRLDVRPFLESDEAPTDATATDTPPPPTTVEPAPEAVEDDDRPFRLTMLRNDPVAEVVITDTLVVREVWGQMRHDGDRVRDAIINSKITDTAEFDLVITDETASRTFEVTADDFGAVASAVGLSESVREGALRIDGVLDDSAPGSPIRGRAVFTNFRMVDAPLLGQILTFPSLIGIANTLGGRGIAFRRGEVPFVLTDDTLTIADGRIRGSQLGILVTGTVDRKADTIDIQGEVAPATLINNLLGNVPIVGQVLTGGGEGVFAATYRINGPREQPVVSVNPVSVIAPGFIRRIVGGFSDGDIPEDDVGGKFPADQD